VAGLAVDDFRMDEWRIDFALARSDAGLMAPSEVTILAIAERALSSIDVTRLSPALNSISLQMEDNQHYLERYNSPVIRNLEALYVSTTMILSAGLDNILAHRQEVAKAFRRGCTDVLHLELVAKRPSATCTTVFLPSSIRAERLLQLIADKYHIGILSDVAPDGREILCIGHSGWVFRDDIYRVIEGLAVGLETERSKFQ
jgi:alanine-glyoxylate transaminase/serine-glyoxylate transaminase/serine-pyruvate transaminase